MSPSKKDKKDKKGKKENLKKEQEKVKVYYVSSSDSCSSRTTKTMSLDSAGTPPDLMTFDFPVDTPIPERRETKEQSPEVRSARAPLSPKPSTSKDPSSATSPLKTLLSKSSCSPTTSPLKQLQSPSAVGISEEHHSPNTPGKQQQSKSSSTVGGVRKQLKTLSTGNKEGSLLESDSLQESSEGVPPQPEVGSVLPELGGDKKRSSSLPTGPPGEQCGLPFSPRTKSEGQIRSSVKPVEKTTPKKKSPLRKALSKCKAQLGFKSSKTKVEKLSADPSVSECIQELSEEPADAKEYNKNPVEQNVAEASAAPGVEQNVTQASATPRVEQNVTEASETPSLEPMDEELARLNDPEPATPRRSTRRPNLSDDPCGSPSKRKDLRK